MESKLENDLFYICSLIEFIGRKTKNKRIDVIHKIGEKEIAKILEFADVYHCEPIEYTAETLILKFAVTNGNFDNVTACRYSVPSVFDIGKVYKRLCFYVVNEYKLLPISAIVNVYSSIVSTKIDDYNSSVFYESPEYLELFYDEKILPHLLTEKLVNKSKKGGFEN